jgi:hypothetical protein
MVVGAELLLVQMSFCIVESVGGGQVRAPLGRDEAVVAWMPAKRDHGWLEARSD